MKLLRNVYTEQSSFATLHVTQRTSKIAVILIILLQVLFKFKKNSIGTNNNHNNNNE